MAIAENLITYDVCTDPRTLTYEHIEVNTTMLLNVYWTKGYRWCPTDLKERRTNKLWKTKHPIISKFYTPMRFWISAWNCSRWIQARVVVNYGKHETIIRFNSNANAEAAANKMIKDFWG